MADQAGSSYQWTLSNGTLVAGQGTRSITYCPGAAGTLGLDCVVTNAAGTASAPGHLDQTVVDPIVITAFAPVQAIITTGDSVDLTATFSGGSATLDPGGIAVTSGTPVPVAPSATTTYTLTVGNASGASASRATSVTVVGPPSISAFAAAAGHAPLAQGTALAASFTGGTGVVGPAGLAILSGTPLTVHPPVPTLYELTVTNAAGRSVKAFAAAYPRQSLAACSSRTFLLKDDGTLWFWGGSTQSGGTGLLLDRDSASPIQQTGLSGLVAVTALEQCAYALKGDGTVWYVPGVAGAAAAQVTGLTQVAALAGGEYHTLALRTDGTVWAWGFNSNGQVGNGTTTNAPVPVQVPGLPAIAGIFAGAYQSFALAADGTLWAWGYNRNGQLGDGTLSDRWSPVRVPGLGEVASLCTGTSHTCALKSDGTLWGWGDGAGSQRSPTRSPSLAGVVAVFSGSYHNLALTSDGLLWAWGSNSAGQLGSGSVGNAVSVPSPVQVPGLAGLLTAAAGSQQSYAVAGDGTVWAWGDNRAGELGDGSLVQQLAPAPVTLPVAVASLGGSTFTAYLLGGDGSLWGWGDTTFGQLQTLATVNLPTPSRLAGPAGATAVSGSEFQGTALAADGSVWYWGASSLAGSFFSNPTPSPAPGLSGVVRLTGTVSDGFALKADGTAWGWGFNDSGQLGDGTTTNRATRSR